MEEEQGLKRRREHTCRAAELTWSCDKDRHRKVWPYVSEAFHLYDCAYGVGNFGTLCTSQKPDFLSTARTPFVCPPGSVAFVEFFRGKEEEPIEIGSSL
jgi:hypothetical protein